MLQFVRYTQHIHTYDMRRNKHNIQTYYRIRLLGLKNDNDKENIVRNYKAFCYRSIKKGDTKTEGKKDS